MSVNPTMSLKKTVTKSYCSALTSPFVTLTFYLRPWRHAFSPRFLAASLRSLISTLFRFRSLWHKLNYMAAFISPSVTLTCVRPWPRRPWPWPVSGLDLAVRDLDLCPALTSRFILSCSATSRGSIWHSRMSARRFSLLNSEDFTWSLRACFAILLFSHVITTFPGVGVLLILKNWSWAHRSSFIAPSFSGLRSRSCTSRRTISLCNCDNCWRLFPVEIFSLPARQYCLARLATIW